MSYVYRSSNVGITSHDCARRDGLYMLGEKVAAEVGTERKKPPAALVANRVSLAFCPLLSAAHTTGQVRHVAYGEGNVNCVHISLRWWGGMYVRSTLSPAPADETPGSRD